MRLVGETKIKDVKNIDELIEICCDYLDNDYKLTIEFDKDFIKNMIVIDKKNDKIVTKKEALTLIAVR